MAQWLNTAFADFDLAIFNFMHYLQVNAGGFFTTFFKVITFLGEKGWLYIVAGVILLLFKKTRKIGFTILISILIGTIVTNLVIKNIVSRPRPFTASDFYYDCWNLVGPTIVGKNSFPSGHTTGATAATVAWILSSNKKYRFTGIAFAILMGVSRIYLFVHYPTDVLAGFIVGTVSAIGGYYAVKGIFSLLEKHNTNKVANFILTASLDEVLIKKIK